MDSFRRLRILSDHGPISWVYGLGKGGLCRFQDVGPDGLLGSHERGRVNVDGHGFAKGQGSGEDPVRSSVRDESGAFAGTSSEDLQLHPIPGRDSSDRAGERASNLDSVLMFKGSEAGRQRFRGSGGLGLSGIADHDSSQSSVGGKLEAFAIRQLPFREAFVVMFRGSADGGGIGLERLNDGLSGGGAPPASADHLGDELEGAFAGSEIGHVQGRVRIDDSDEPHTGKVEPLGDHLSSGEEPDLAGSEAIQDVMKVVPGVHGVRIDSNHGPGAGEIRVEAAEILLHALGSESEDRRLLAAERAGGWESELRVAVMAADPPVATGGSGILVADHAGIAFGAGHHPSAAVIRAGDVVGVSPPIEQQHHLAATLERAFDRAAESGADQPDPGPVEVPALLGEVDDLDPGEGEPRSPFRKTVDGTSFGSGRVVPTLEGWRRRAEDHRAVRELSATDGRISSLIPRRLILFVGRIMFLVDDDQSESAIGNRREDRGPGAEDDVGLTIGDSSPFAVPLCRGEAGMEDGGRRSRESGQDPGRGLRGEGDLGNENEHGSAGIEGLSRESQVDLCLAAPGHAEEEVAREASAEGASDRLHGGGLRCIQFDIAILEAGPCSRPGFDGGDGLGFDQPQFRESFEDRGTADAGPFGEVVGGDREIRRRGGENGVVDGSLFLTESRQWIGRDFGGFDQEPLGGSDALSNRGGHDVREGDSDRAGVIRGNPGCKVEQLRGKRREVIGALDERFDAVGIKAFQGRRFGSEAFHDGSGDRGVPAAQWHQNPMACLDVLAGLRQ